MRIWQLLWCLLGGALVLTVQTDARFADYLENGEEDSQTESELSQIYYARSEGAKPSKPPLRIQNQQAKVLENIYQANISRRQELRKVDEKENTSLGISSTVNTNSTGKPITLHHRSKSSDKEVIALIILVVIFGFGAAAILTTCLLHKYRARLDGYTLMTRNNAVRRRNTHCCNSTDYKLMDAISEEGLFLEEEDTYSSQEIFADHSETAGFGDDENQSLGTTKIDCSKETANLISNNDDCTSTGQEDKASQQGLGSRRAIVDEGSSIQNSSSNEIIDSPTKEFNHKLRRYRQWSVHLQRDETSANQLTEKEIKRIFTLERTRELPFQGDSHDDVKQNTGYQGNVSSSSSSADSLKFKLTEGLDRESVPNLDEITEHLDRESVPNLDEITEDLDRESVPNLDEITEHLDRESVPNLDEITEDLDRESVPNLDEITEDLDRESVPNLDEITEHLDRESVHNVDEITEDLDRESVPNLDEITEHLDRESVPNLGKITEDLDRESATNLDEITEDLDRESVPNLDEISSIKWNRKKRDSIQAAVYNRDSDSDEDYKLIGSIDEGATSETDFCSNVDNKNFSTIMSDSIIYFDYGFSKEHDLTLKNEPDVQCFQESSTRNTDVVFGSKKQSDHASNFGPTKENTGSLSQCPAVKSGILEASSKDADSTASGATLHGELSRAEIKEVLRDLMLDVSSRIYHESFKSVLHRSRSDSQLILDRHIETWNSCMSLKSFSTSNLRGKHLMPSPLSTPEKNTFRKIAGDKPKKSLHHRLKILKGFFKKRKKAKEGENNKKSNVKG